MNFLHHTGKMWSSMRFYRLLFVWYAHTVKRQLIRNYFTVFNEKDQINNYRRKKIHITKTKWDAYNISYLICIKSSHLEIKDTLNVHVEITSLSSLCLKKKVLCICILWNIAWNDMMMKWFYNIQSQGSDSLVKFITKPVITCINIQHYKNTIN